MRARAALERASGQNPAGARTRTLHFEHAHLAAILESAAQKQSRTRIPSPASTPVRHAPDDADRRRMTRGNAILLERERHAEGHASGCILHRRGVYRRQSAGGPSSCTSGFRLRLLPPPTTGARVRLGPSTKPVKEKASLGERRERATLARKVCPLLVGQSLLKRCISGSAVAIRVHRRASESALITGMQLVPLSPVDERFRRELQSKTKSGKKRNEA